MSQITTHVLDTSKGKPADGITIKLEAKDGENWSEISRGVTNHDGRISDLLTQEETLQPGIYKLVFETIPYFNKQQVRSFYPMIEIVFETVDGSHYHVPLLLNPYGYSTYRGS